jgi:hypothetical protein
VQQAHLLYVGQGFVVFFDGFVGGFEVQIRHRVLSVARSGDRPQLGMANPLLANNGAIIAEGRGKGNGRYPNNQNNPTGNSLL